MSMETQIDTGLVKRTLEVEKTRKVDSRKKEDITSKKHEIAAYGGFIQRPYKVTYGGTSIRYWM